MSAWFIDALDARAGIAFACYRTPDLSLEVPELDRPAVHIAAPHFMVERLSSRTPGFSAARNSCQLGVFLNGGEVGFETLDDLVEFVRRTYVSGGSGDGPSGIGVRPTPPDLPPDGDGDPGPKSRSPRDESAASVMSMFEAFRRASGEQVLGTYVGDPMEQTPRRTVAFLAGSQALPRTGPSIASDPGTLLAMAVSQIADALFRHCPAHHSGEELARWWDSVRALGAAARRLGLASRMLDGAAGDALEKAGGFLVKHHGRLLVDGAGEPWVAQADRRSSHFGLLVAFWLLFDLPTTLVHLMSDAAPQVWIGDLWHFDGGGSGFEAGDRYEDLAGWPVPQSIASELGLIEANHTLADVLCRALGSPVSIAPFDEETAAILLFGAVHLDCTRAGASWASSRSMVASEWRIAVAQRARLWMAKQLPQRAFAKEVETIIGSANEVRYA